MYQFWIAQGVGVLICFLAAYSYFRKTKEDFLYLQITINVLYAIEYALLGVWTAAVINLVSTVKFITFRRDAIAGVRTSFCKSLFFCFNSVILGLVTYKDLLSLIPIAIAVMITFAAAQNNPYILRTAYAMANLLWIFYNFKSMAYVSAMYCTVELVVSMTSIYVLWRRMKRIRAYLDKGEDPPLDEEIGAMPAEPIIPGG